MDFFHIIAPILVGALIGYCTNYIAIKMLFRPTKAYHIGKMRVPFTPGVIPKNQSRIARAVGDAVGNELLTSEDILSKVTKPEMIDGFAAGITNAIFEKEEPMGSFITLQKDFSGILSQRLVDTVQDMNLQPAIRKIADDSIGGILRNPMLVMFIGADMLDSIYAKVEHTIKEYVATNGKLFLEPLIDDKIQHVMNRSLAENLGMIQIDRDMIKEIVGRMLLDMIQSKGTEVLSGIDISGIVREKIEAMDVKELERLTMTVMKQELQAVINLGAVIGAVIGILNVFLYLR